MANRRSVIAAFTAALAAWPAIEFAHAQQTGGGWQTETAAPAPDPSRAAAPASPADPPAVQLPPNTTVVPRTRTDPKASGLPSGPAQVTLVALLTEDGQSIEQGLVWRVFRAKPTADPNGRLVATHREASPTVRLDPGDYFVNVAFGRAHLTRKITVAGDRAVQERFVLNAGGLRVSSVLSNGEAVNEKAVSYDIYSDERDQYGQRTKIMSAVRPGLIVRLNAGIYNIVGTYGDANATARSDVTVEAGKLTEATLTHAAAKVTFKLVTRAGGDAIPDTQWTVANTHGEPVKESVGALPTHVLAPGSYTVSARHQGRVFQRSFTVQAGDAAQVEVMAR